MRCRKKCLIVRKPNRLNRKGDTAPIPEKVVVAWPSREVGSIKKIMARLEVEVGQRYGRLTVEGVARITRQKKFYRCRCDCGTVKAVRKDHLLTARVVSCGCHRKEMFRVFGWGR